MRGQSDLIGRREFVGTVTATLGGVTLFGGLMPRATAGRDTTTVLKRSNVAGMDANHPILRSYISAITAMQQRSMDNPKDPLGWTFQANMHWTPSGEMILDPVWNGCQHGTRWFFPWHRGYLYFFERIIRKMSNDSTFTLPYWKWDAAATLALPSPFRIDQNSVLFDGSRGINDGSDLPAEVGLDLAQAMSQDFFDPSADGREGFTLIFDGFPHGDVHVDTGGRMGSVPTAARDPIFYLHHTNVDRLWNRWLDNPLHSNPNDQQWLQNQWNQGQTVPFKYYDTDGQLVQLTTADVLAMTKEVRYDDDQPAAAPVVRSAPPAIQRVVPPETLASASKESFPLSNQPLSVPLGLGATGSRKLTRVLKGAERRVEGAGSARVFAIVQGISVKATDVPVHYSVYLKTKDQKPEEKGEYVGTINFFGKTEHLQGQGHGHEAGSANFDRKFEITSALAKLGKSGSQPIEELVLTFVPVLNGKGKDEAALRQTDVRGLSFERVTIQAVE